ncbi:hypothetical protein [Frigoribacterium sp. CFBP9030]|uniref:hypothetical protein n=1 Tax=Frigoribacterium sp. CFBP9030 TaxID=3096537 RepID=UPI002A6992C3|nr:hypothetical protein [Frigoribacterium sp. CFBP9030]MDY0891426.1 hypothetical protein [Frigoribacterium sp. CFBP9030]
MPGGVAAARAGVFVAGGRGDSPFGVALARLRRHTSLRLSCAAPPEVRRASWAAPRLLGCAAPPGLRRAS